AAGAGATLRAVAAGLAAAALGALIGALFAGVIVWAGRLPAADALRVGGAAVGGGAAWALVGLAVAHLTERPGGVDGTRVLAAMLGLGIAALVAALRFGEPALLAVIALGVAAPAIAAGPVRRRAA
ncbi:MAG TPA: hypothetical protein VL172_22925, partial [Kofleriaceae bacterium]|nr:hypothetical protein [Kofleriaceae bacterium]